MIIAFDARPLRPVIRHWGVGVMVDNLIARLVDRFRFSGIAPAFPGAEQQGFDTWPLIPHLQGLAFEGSAFLVKNFDAYWGTNHLLPGLMRRPSVVTVHDLLLLKYPSEQSRARYFAWRFMTSVRRADRVIAVSKTTADDLLAIAPEVGKKLEVALQGFDVPLEADGGEGCAEQAGLDSPYVVMLGAHRPRKNLPLAVAAISLLRDRGAAVKLVVTGNIDPLFEGLIADSQEFVKCVGVVPKARVFRLLKGAVGLVFPSLYEGFGFPMLEAMAAGCPVLALDTAINREIAGEGAWFLPPEPQAWGQAIARLLGNTSLVTDLREAGFGNLHRFSWDTTAARYAEAFSALGAARQERSPNEAVTAGCP